MSQPVGLGPTLYTTCSMKSWSGAWAGSGIVDGTYGKGGWSRACTAYSTHTRLSLHADPGVSPHWAMLELMGRVGPKEHSMCPMSSPCVIEPGPYTVYGARPTHHTLHVAAPLCGLYCLQHTDWTHHSVPEHCPWYTQSSWCPFWTFPRAST